VVICASSQEILQPRPPPTDGEVATRLIWLSEAAASAAAAAEDFAGQTCHNVIERWQQFLDTL
jgi:hypothetical protein